VPPCCLVRNENIINTTVIASTLTVSISPFNPAHSHFTSSMVFRSLLGPQPPRSPSLKLLYLSSSLGLVNLRANGLGETFSWATAWKNITCPGKVLPDFDFLSCPCISEITES